MKTIYSSDFMLKTASTQAQAKAGVSFEAGGGTFRPVVSHSMSGTLMLISEGFVLFFIIIF